MKIFSRKGVEKDMRAKSIEEGEIERMNRNIQDEIRIITDARNKKISEVLSDKKLQRDVVDFKTGDMLVRKGETADRDDRRTASRRRELLALPVDEETRETIRMFVERAENRIRVLEQKAEERREDLQKGDELPPGVIKMIKVYVAMKRKLSRSATRWPDATATRASSAASSPRRTCRTCRTARRSRSCSTRSAFRRA